MHILRRKIVALLSLAGLAVSLNTLGCGLDSPESDRPGGLLYTSPSRVTFGATALGSRSERPLTLSNEGEDLLRLEIEIVGDEEEYEDGVLYLVGEQPNYLEIESGQDLDIAIAFSPLESRSYEGVVRITNSDHRGQRYQIPIRTGTATPELFVLSPVIFPDVSVGSSVSSSVEIQNIGYAPLVVEDVVISGEEFSVSGFEPFMVAPDESEVESLSLCNFDSTDLIARRNEG